MTCNAKKIPLAPAKMKQVEMKKKMKKMPKKGMM